MPQGDVILNMPEFTIKKVTGYNPIIINVIYRRKARCIYCNTRKVHQKAAFIRNVRHESYGHANTIMRFKAYKFYCPHCVGKSTIERWYHCYYLREVKELKSHLCPEVLDIDEHFFTRKQGYVTTLCDLRNHRIFDLVKGRSPGELAHYFEQLPHKERIKVICMDLREISLSRFEQSPFKRLVRLGKTFTQWKDEIPCMWRFRKNNGITEGFHRKMKLVQRRAYGFRNFENYRLRVKVLCA